MGHKEQIFYFIYICAAAAAQNFANRCEIMATDKQRQLPVARQQWPCRVRFCRPAVVLVGGSESQIALPVCLMFVRAPRDDQPNKLAGGGGGAKVMSDIENKLARLNWSGIGLVSRVKLVWPNFLSSRRRLFFSRCCCCCLSVRDPRATPTTILIC